jgi:hypothetical protein
MTEDERKALHENDRVAVGRGADRNDPVRHK